MTGPDGPTVLDDSAVEELLTGGAGPADPDLQRVVALLGTLADGSAPPPTAALADLLERGVEPVAVPFRPPGPARRRWAARTGAGLATAAASVVLAGTAAALPPAVQDAVADVVSALTPFELPRPPAEPGRPEPARDAGAADDTVDTVPAGTPTPTGAPTPSTEPPAAPTGGPTPTADDDSSWSGGRDDSDDPQRQERDRQRAAEEAAEESAEQSQRAAEEAAEASQRAADDAADEAEDAARDAAREREDAADRAADEAEDAEDG